MDRLRTPFLVAALILIFVVVLIEVGDLLLTPSKDAVLAGLSHLSPAPDPGVVSAELANNQPPPGLGIAYMAFIDGTLLVTVTLVVLSLVIGRNLEGRIQGIVTLVFSILIILGGIVAIFAAFQFVIFMIALLLSAPFGTIAYLALYGFFDRGGAGVVLSLIMILKIAFAICLVLAQQRFLQAKGLVVLVLLSLIANVVVAFLQGFPPGFLVTITDAIAAIVVGIIGVVLAIVLAIFAVIAVLKSLAVNRDLVG